MATRPRWLVARHQQHLRAQSLWSSRQVSLGATAARLPGLNNLNRRPEQPRRTAMDNSGPKPESGDHRPLRLGGQADQCDPVPVRDEAHGAESCAPGGRAIGRDPAAAVRAVLKE